MNQTSIHDSIKKDMTIGVVVDKYPEVIETLQEAGVHCVGCHVSYDETLEQGFKGHGMTDEEIDSVINKLNEAINNASKEPKKEFIITKKAAEKLSRILKENNQEGSGLRVGVAPGGCSGFQYELEVDKDIAENDKVFEEDGVKIIINKEQMPMLKGAKLDYVEALQGAGFKITNPNAKSTCGCGSSFG